MAGSFRPNNLTHCILTVLACLLLVLAHAHTVCASPVTVPLGSRYEPSHAAHHWKRVTPVVVTSTAVMNTSVIDPSTNQVIPQGPGTDGGGMNLSLPSIVWLAFIFIIGVPLAFAGIRLWRATTGMAIGLAAAVCVWAAFVNTLNADGIPDLVLTVIVIASFAVGFAFGVLNVGRLIGILILGVLGGFSIGVRTVLLRPGLLISPYSINWLVLAIFIILGLGAVLWKQRFGIVSSCAAIGSFLIALGVDLLLEKQAGMSFALRFFFDRNNSHFLAIVHKGYNPTVMSQIILGASIGVIPVLAFGQHKIFKGPFRPEKTSASEDDAASLVETGPDLGMQETKSEPLGLLKSRFSIAEA